MRQEARDQTAHLVRFLTVLAAVEPMKPLIHAHLAGKRDPVQVLLDVVEDIEPDAALEATSGSVETQVHP